MPTTSFNVTLINAAVSNYSRQQVLEALDEMQKIVLGTNLEQMAVIDPATGMPPYLVTTALQRQYNCPDDCRETAAIFFERPTRQYSPSQNRAFYTEFIFRNATYWKVAARSTNRLVDQLATVTFIDDPGDTTNRYFHWYYPIAVTLTSETIQLIIPEEVHYLLRQGVIALLSTENYGETGFDTAVIEKIGRKIRSKMNKGTQARAERTPVRMQDRDGEWPNSYYY
jgi:hypothetical protein